MKKILYLIFLIFFTNFAYSGEYNFFGIELGSEITFNANDELSINGETIELVTVLKARKDYGFGTSGDRNWGWDKNNEYLFAGKDTGDYPKMKMAVLLLDKKLSAMNIKFMKFKDDKFKVGSISFDTNFTLKSKKECKKLQKEYFEEFRSKSIYDMTDADLSSELAQLKGKDPIVYVYNDSTSPNDYKDKNGRVTQVSIECYKSELYINALDVDLDRQAIIIGNQ